LLFDDNEREGWFRSPLTKWIGQVISLGSLIYAPLAQMAPFAIMLLILLIKLTGLYGSKLLKR
jgi:branched-subunit amino acid ABC-type transport system permease component